MAQFARPDSDVSETNWNGTGSSADKWANLDESTASDTDFNWSTNNTPGAVLEVGLSDVTDPAASTGHTVRYRVAQTNAGTLDGGGTAVTLTVALVQGTTVVASAAGIALTGSWADGSFNLSGAEADAITDYTDLRIRVTTAGGGGSPANRRGGAISWAELETPDAPTGVDAAIAQTLPAFTQAAVADVPGAQAIHDDVTRADQTGPGTSAEGWSWNLLQGSLDVVSNELRTTNTSETRVRAEIDLDSDDHALEALVFTDDDTAGANVGFHVRWDDVDATFYSFQVNLQANDWSLWRCIAGSFQFITSGSVTLGADTWHLVRFEVEGDNLRGYANGVELVNTTDTNIPAGRRVGFRPIKTTTGFIAIDDVRAGNLAQADVAATLPGFTQAAAGTVTSDSIADTFDRTDQDGLGTSSEGWSWEPMVGVAGDIDIVSNRARSQVLNGGRRQRAAVDLSSDDHFVEATIYVNDDTTYWDVSVIARASGSGGTESFYMLTHRTSNGGWGIWRVVNGGAPSLLSSIGSATLTAGTPYVARLEVDGDTLTGYVDDVQVAQVTDTTITTGKRVGITAQKNTAGYLEWDDFSAGLLSAGVDADAAQTFGALTQSAAADAIQNADGAQTLPGLTQAAAADLDVLADGAATLPGFTQAAATDAVQAADIVQALPALTQDATAGQIVSVTATSPLPSVTQAASADSDVEGAGASTLPSLAQQAAADLDVQGAVAQALPGIVQSVTTSVPVDATAGQTFPALTQDAEASVTSGIEAAATQDLPALTQAAQADAILEGSAAQDLPALSQAAAADAVLDADAAQTLPPLGQDAAGTVAENAAAITTTLPSFGQAANADTVLVAATASQLGALASQVAADLVIELAGDSQLPALGQTVVGDLDVFAAAASTLAAIQQSAQLATVALGQPVGSGRGVRTADPKQVTTGPSRSVRVAGGPNQVRST